MDGVILILLAVLTLMTGCKSHKSVVTEETHKENMVVRVDSSFKSDSVSENLTKVLQEVDSAYLAGIGIVAPPSRAWLLHETHERTAKSERDIVRCDTVVKTDTIVKFITRTETVTVNVLKWWHIALTLAGFIFVVCFLRHK